LTQSNGGQGGETPKGGQEDGMKNENRSKAWKNRGTKKKPKPCEKYTHRGIVQKKPKVGKIRNTQGFHPGMCKWVRRSKGTQKKGEVD